MANAYEEQILHKLKDILLEEDRSRLKLIEQDIRALQQMVSEQQLSDRVEPVITKRFEIVKTQIAEIAASLDLSAAIRQQIKENRDEMIDSLYPIIGKLVQKYIQIELEKLSERIDQQIDNTFSWQAIRREFLSLFGVKENDMIIQGLMQPIVQEAFLIEQLSGLLKGHYSKESAIDQDMIAGMLTAIKSFVEDSFTKDGNLDTIEYGTLKIFIQNYQRFYLVAVVSGMVDASFKSKLLDSLFELSNAHLINVPEEELSDEYVSGVLKTYFQTFNDNNAKGK